MMTNGIVAIMVNENNKGRMYYSKNLYRLIRDIVYLLSWRDHR